MTITLYQIRNKLTNKSILACGRTELGAQILGLQKSSSANAHAVLGTRDRPLRRGIDYECTLLKTFPDATEKLDIELYKNRVIERLGDDCLTAANEKAEREWRKSTGRTCYTIALMVKTEPRLCVNFALTAEALSRAMINGKSHSRQSVGTPAYEFYHNGKPRLFGIGDNESKEWAEAAVHTLQYDFNDTGLMLWTASRAWAGGAHDERRRATGIDSKGRTFSEFLASVRQSAHEILAPHADRYPSLGPFLAIGAAAAAAAPAAPAASEAAALAAPAARVSPDMAAALAATQQALDRKRRRETRMVSQYSIYVAEHPTDRAAHYVFGTMDLATYLTVMRGKLQHPDLSVPAALRTILVDAPADYTPRLLETLREVSHEETLRCLEIHRNAELRARAPEAEDAAPAAADPLRAYGMKLVAVRSAASKWVFCARTKESLIDFRRRMEGRMRSFMAATDKFNRAFHVMMHPDHVFEVVAEFGDSASLKTINDSRRRYLDDLQRAGYTVANDIRLEKNYTDFVLYLYYLMTRNDPADERCYVGRTTQSIEKRIAMHFQKRNEDEYASNDIVRDGEFNYRVIAAYLMPDPTSSKEIEARIMEQYPTNVNREFQVMRARMRSGAGRRDSMTIDDAVLDLGGTVVMPFVPPSQPPLGLAAYEDAMGHIKQLLQRKAQLKSERFTEARAAQPPAEGDVEAGQPGEASRSDDAEEGDDAGNDDGALRDSLQAALQSARVEPAQQPPAATAAAPGSGPAATPTPTRSRWGPPVAAARGASIGFAVRSDNSRSFREPPEARPTGLSACAPATPATNPPMYATPASLNPPTPAAMPIPGPTVLMNGRRVSINDIFMD
jgi:tetratricopeptide (TPR) repeat protein